MVRRSPQALVACQLAAFVFASGSKEAAREEIGQRESSYFRLKVGGQFIPSILSGLSLNGCGPKHPSVPHICPPLADVGATDPNSPRLVSDLSRLFGLPGGPLPNSQPFRAPHLPAFGRCGHHGP